MRIRAPKIIRKALAKWVSKELSKEIDVDFRMDLDDLTIETTGLTYRIHTAQTYEINKRDLKRLIKEGL